MAKFDLRCQRSIQKKIAYLTKEVDRKEIVSISKTVLELQEFEIYILASEAQFDLGGQRLFRKKVAYLTKEVDRIEIVSISKTVFEL